MELPAGVCLSSSSPSSSCSRQYCGFVEGVSSDHSFLEVSVMVSNSVGPEHSGGEAPSSPARHRHRSDDRLGFTQAQPSSSCRLEDFRRLHASSISDGAFRLISESWRRSSSARYDAAWRSFKDFVCQPTLSANRLSLQVDLKVVSDYLTFVFNKGLAELYRTIVCLHRSVLSTTLSHVDGAAVGEHPVICRLIKGFFSVVLPLAFSIMLGM